MRLIDIHPADFWFGINPGYLTGETGYWTDPAGSGGDPSQERACIGNKGQVCPADNTPLDCIDDYIGGGSHYWHLQCRVCSADYTYDTYRFALEPWDRSNEHG